MQTSSPLPELVVLDGTAMLFRAYYSVRYQAPDGREVEAVLGMTESILRVMRRLQPTHIAITFDAGRKTFRNEIDPRYKANRDAPPEDLIPQFDLAVDISSALGFSVLRVPGFEADDLMATLATAAQRLKFQARVCAIDKDLLQLVDDAPPPIRVEDPRTNELLDEAGVCARIGVKPTQLCDYFALVGDSSDNVPGVRGIGAKGAQALIHHFGSLDNLYDRLPEVGDLSIRGASTLAQKLESGRSDAYLARTLVRLKKDVTLPFPAEELDRACKWMGPGGSETDSLFSSLGFQGPLFGLRRVAQAQG